MVHAIVQAVGLVLVVEGLIYAAAPQAMKRMLAELRNFRLSNYVI
ncbi:MAG: DUF2065 domain-containing protein [Aestuariivirga sp.]